MGFDRWRAFELPVDLAMKRDLLLSAKQLELSIIRAFSIVKDLIAYYNGGWNSSSVER